MSKIVINLRKLQNYNSSKRTTLCIGMARVEGNSMKLNKNIIRIANTMQNNVRLI
jgi:hypothetical protein